MEIYSILVFLAIGIFTGALSGLLGIGGGIIFVPAILYILPLFGPVNGEITYVAVATSLFAGIFASGSSFYNHFRNDNVDLKKGVILSVGSVGAALFFSHYLTGISPDVIKYVFAALLLAAALRMLLERNGKKEGEGINLHSAYLIFVGILVGAISAFTGIGGGVVFLPVLTFLFAVSVRKAVGTSSLATFLTMLGASVSYYIIQSTGSGGHSLINFHAGIPMGIGAVIGARIGVKFVFKLPVTVIKKIFSVLLILVIIKLLLG